MSVLTSEVGIVSEALMQLGLPPVLNLDDDSDAPTRVARRIINQRRQAFLANNQWNFATIQGVATLVADRAPTIDYDAYYSVPADCLRVVRVGSSDDPIGQNDWAYQGGEILYTGDAATIPIEYVKDVTDYSLWSPLVVDAFILELAVKLCMPLTRDLKMKDFLMKEAVNAYREAAAVDLQERPSYFTDASRTQQAREWMPSASADFKLDQSVLDA